MKIIGFVGYKGVGKTTLAKSIPNAQIVSFAEPLYGMVSALLDIPVKDLSVDKNMDIRDLVRSEHVKTVRDLMEYLGTTLIRNQLDLDVFVRAAIRKAKKSKKGYVIFDDVRFLNEALAIKQEGGALIRVHRTNDNASLSIAESEIELIKCDGVVNTDRPKSTSIKTIKSIVKWNFYPNL